ncbi:MAG TPA: 50S ribosomal protein L17 [Longimicrobiaceae bacterium]|jgi:large subunit ribosomal protein L17|nr:50S ribosomal protein L17 [Longimicrobiaceae bacterium]
MRHNNKGSALGRTTSHKLAMLRNMTTSLFLHGRIETTTAKAKELRPFAEKLITLAKRGDLHSRRLAARHVQDKDVLFRLFDSIGPRFAARPGGYTRILKTGFRQGDGADTALIELVDRGETAAPAAAAK